MSPQMAMLIDTTRCTGCEDCVAACKRENRLGEDEPRRWKARIDALSSTRYTTILRQDGHNVRHLCRHCLEPACASACIVGALVKTPSGPVVYDGDKCMGCRYCMNACPYGIPRYDWDLAVPYVRKCTLCAPRVEKGQVPACVEACGYDVMAFGPREEMLKLAHERISTQPDRYIDKVWGEHEVGGTSVLYISDIPLDFLAWKPGLDDTPLPERTWAALKKVPPIIAGMAGLMASTYWIIGRRMKLAAEAAKAQSALAEAAGAQTDEQTPEEGEEA